MGGRTDHCEPRKLALKIGRVFAKSIGGLREIRAFGLGRGGGDLNQRGFLAGDAHTMKIETPFGKPPILAVVAETVF